MNELTGKVALITGATSGIGEACAVRFAKAGAIVLVAGRNKERGNNVVAKIETLGGNAEFIEMDVLSDDSLISSAEYVRRQYKHIDILVNNAGIFPEQPQMGELTRDDIDKVYKTNVGGVLMTIQYFSPLLSNGGTILNNSSVSGLFDNTLGYGSYIYASSKSAIIKITKVLAKRLAPSIRVNAIAPGYIKTPLYHTFNEEVMSGKVPLHRVGQSEDVAALANYLVSDDASYITGVVVTIDGGLSL